MRLSAQSDRCDHLRRVPHLSGLDAKSQPVPQALLIGEITKVGSNVNEPN